LEFLQEAEVWVGVGLALFFAVLVWAKAPAAAMKALDTRAVKIQAELDEALRLREEAQALLAQIKVQREASEKVAAEMIANAEAEAIRLRDEAAVRLDELIKRRQLMAERKIANAEAQAASEVKAAAADLATQLAEAVLAARLKDLKSDPLVDHAVEQIGERFH
jgi:F-type H+-transporting ATPase subunit b